VNYLFYPVVKCLSLCKNSIYQEKNTTSLVFYFWMILPSFDKILKKGLLNYGSSLSFIHEKILINIPEWHLCTDWLVEAAKYTNTNTNFGLWFHFIKIDRQDSVEEDLIVISLSKWIERKKCGVDWNNVAERVGNAICRCHRLDRCRQPRKDRRFFNVEKCQWELEAWWVW